MSSTNTKQALIGNMFILLKERRFSDFTIEELCKMSNISRRTFYRYYSDKYELLRDVYLEYFFNKIEVDEGLDFWNIFERICEQVYSDKNFFRHALEVKGQNGFYDEASKILTPFFMREAPSYEFIDDMKAYFVATDISRLLQLIERWLKAGFKQTPKEFSDYIRANHYVYGQWTSQLAARLERSSFPPEIITDFDGYISKMNK